MFLGYRHSKEWLCQQHSLNKIRSWVDSLNSVYFFRAFGGHANDPDYFGTTIKFNNNKNDLDDILKRLEINNFSEDSYCGRRVINNYEWFIFIDYEREKISFHKSTNYDVTDSDFEAALDLDKLLHQAGLHEKVDQDIESNSCCVSKEKYYDLFEKINP